MYHRRLGGRGTTAAPTSLPLFLRTKNAELRLWAGPVDRAASAEHARVVLSSSPAKIDGLSFQTVANQLTHLDEHVFMLRVPNNEGALPILFTFHKLKAT